MKLCVALLPIPLLAVIVIGYVPPVPTLGVPESTPLVLSVTPLGRAPDSENVGAGKPVAVTVNEPAVPTVNVVLFVLVIAGAWLTVNVKLCVAFGETPLFAVIVMTYVPPVPAAGVPERTPALLSVTPLGSVPVSVNVGAGVPVAVTVNIPALPTTNVALFPLVITGATVVTVPVLNPTTTDDSVADVVVVPVAV